MIKKVIVVILVIGVILSGVVIVGSSMSSGVFSLSISDVLSLQNDLIGKGFKVTGKVAMGSVRRLSQGFEYEFAIQDELGRKLFCFYQGTLPDPFAEGRDVILEGTLSEKGGMLVKKVIVKCPSKYQEEGMPEEQYQEYYNKKYKQGHNP